MLDDEINNLHILNHTSNAKPLHIVTQIYQKLKYIFMKMNVELQKRAARIILKVDYITPSVEMFQRLRWMTVSQQGCFDIQDLKQSYSSIYIQFY